MVEEDTLVKECTGIETEKINTVVEGDGQENTGKTSERKRDENSDETKTKTPKDAKGKGLKQEGTNSKADCTKRINELAALEEGEIREEEVAVQCIYM